MFFKDIVTEHLHSIQNAEIPTENPVMLNDLLDSINLGMIRKLLQKQKGSSYETCDGVPFKHLTMNKNTLATLLHPIPSAIAPTQKPPDNWKTAFIVPVFKSSCCCSIDNSWRFSLLPKTSINLERFVFTFLHDSLLSKPSPKYFGFQSNKNSTLQLLDYIEQS